MTPDQLSVAHRRIALPGVTLHVAEAGSGPLVVLLHGFPENWWSWRYQMEAIAQAGFHVVAPDLRGYGESERHGPFDVETLASDVVALIDAYGESKAIIVGHDWGGGVAWHLGATRPERVAKLVVLNCPHLTVFQRALLHRPSWKQLKRSWYFFFFLLPRVPEWLLTRRDAGNVARVLKASVTDRAHFGPDEIRPFRDSIQQPGAAAAMVGWYRTAVWDAVRQLREPRPYDAVLAPTLLIWGLKDPALDFDVLVPGTERFAPRLEIVTVPEAGHFVHAEQPAAVNKALLQFLER